MLFDPTAAELIYFGNESVKKIAVVADTDKRAVEILQRRFEHVFGLHVQVVRRLIQNKQVAWFQ